MNWVVLDASVAVKWFVEDVLTAEAVAAGRRYHFTAPALLLSEVANGLWKYARRGDLRVEDCREALEVLAHSIQLKSAPALIAEAVELAIALDHPVYDCHYLILARREGTPLLSADRRLLRLAREDLDIEAIDLAEIPRNGLS